MWKDIYIFHFLSTPTDKTWDFVKEISGSNAIACFDLEDSIPNSNGSCNSILKIESRDKILNFIRGKVNKSKRVDFGIRMNQYGSSEFQKDVDFLSNFIKYEELNCIFLPKVESSNDIINCIHTLKKSNIIYNELIPVIESSRGFDELPRIVSVSNNEFEKFAFGHCDFNLDKGLFPFHHQYSSVYWEWIEFIFAKTKETSKIFINSPFLFLNDNMTFNKILIKLGLKFNHNFGQITLTLKQTRIANEFRHRYSADNADYIIQDTSKEKLSAKKLIDAFEKYKHANRNFAVIPDKKILISPHEFKAAKSFYKNARIQRKCFLIVGGCFTQQHNIEPSFLYHQLLKNRIEETDSLEINLSVIRYERLTKCLDKVRTAVKNEKPNLILFHIRPEPLIRISKFYYKYRDAQGKSKGSLNISFLNKIMAEYHEILINPIIDQAYEYPRESFVHRLFININHLIGILIGNLESALNTYSNLVLEINRFCQKENIWLVVVGSVSRPHTFLENKLAEKLDSRIESVAYSSKIPYVKCIGVFSEENRKLFGAEGIFVNEEGHNRVANLIYENLKMYNLF